MKKLNLWIYFLLIFLMLPAFIFAEAEKTGSGSETTVSSVLSQTETSSSTASSATAVSTASATVTGTSTETQVKVEMSTETKIDRDSATASKIKKQAEAPAAATLAALAASVSAEEMKKNWDALFSKDTTPGSITYTVQPGDNLYVLAIKNHTTVNLIKKINKLDGDTIYPEMKLKIQTEPFSIFIKKSENTLTLFADGKPVKKYSVATGKKNSTPVGDFKITEKLVNPTWFKTGAILPPGSPENALGTRWLGFDKQGYGIHGTIEPKSIGTQASEGCIRMLNQDVEELYGIVPSGAKITIQD